MYHITRCPNCRTSFRVTDAHLSAFDGKVRCGRCAFVFDALSQLQGESRPREAAKPATTAPSPKATPVPVPEVAQPKPEPTKPTKPTAAETQAQEDAAYGLDSVTSQLEAAAEAERDGKDDSLASQSLQHLASVLSQAGLPASLADDAPKAAAARAEPDGMLELDLNFREGEPQAPLAPTHDPDHLGDDHGLHDLPAGGIEVIEIPPAEAAAAFSSADFEAWHSATSASVEAALPPAETPEPEPAAMAAVSPLVGDTASGTYRPILTAQDEAMLRVPGGPSPWRWLWSIPALLAAIALGGQVAYRYHTDLAIQLPGIAPKLQRFCAMAGCTMTLPSRAEFLRTEWNELVSLPEHPNLIQLNATLRNQASYAQALPMLELTLTDDNDRIVARKAFSPRDYLAPLADGTPSPLPASLAANGELRAFLQLDLGDMRSSGYTLSWFYPVRH